MSEQEERNANFTALTGALQEYFRILKRDFDKIMESDGDHEFDEDANFLYAEMARTGTFLKGLSEDAFNELGPGRVAYLTYPEPQREDEDAEYNDYMAENDNNGPRYGKD